VTHLKIGDSTHFRQQYLLRKSYSENSIIVNNEKTKLFTYPLVQNGGS